MQYWGFDLGDGESTLARVSSEGKNYPEIIEVEGNKVIITVWAIMRDGEIRIGDKAARSAAAAVRSAARFKRRFLNAQSDSAALIRDFSARVFESLRGSGDLVGGEKSNSVYVGCPAGWNAEARERYQRIFETIGFPTPHVVSESRAVMVGAIQSNSVRDYVDLRSKTVLVVDIGSSTTDFAYINKGKEAEIRTGGEVALGGGVMDEVLLNACVDRSPKAAALRKVLAESESWQVDCELHARHLKERYYSMPAGERGQQECVESLLITYDEPLILDLSMDAEMSRLLTDTPCPSWAASPSSPSSARDCGRSGTASAWSSRNCCSSPAVSPVWRRSAAGARRSFPTPSSMPTGSRNSASPGAWPGAGASTTSCSVSGRRWTSSSPPTPWRRWYPAA